MNSHAPAGKVFLFNPKLDSLFFIVLAYVPLLLIPVNNQDLLTKVFNVVAALGFTHIFITMMPVFFDSQIRGFIGNRGFVTALLFHLMIVCAFLFYNYSLLYIYYIITYFHGVAQFYGFVRVTHRKSKDSSDFKKFELSYFLLFLSLGAVIEHTVFKPDMGKITNFSYVPSLTSFISAKYILGFYFISLIIYLGVKFKKRSDNYGALFLILCAHGIYLVSLFLTSNWIIRGLMMKLTHDIPYLYYCHKHWSTSSTYTGIFKDKKKLCIPWIFTSLLVGIFLSFKMTNTSYFTGEPTWFLMVYNIPIFFHYYMDSIIWKKRFNLKVV